jgi:hypothetical protein
MAKRRFSPGSFVWRVLTTITNDHGGTWEGELVDLVAHVSDGDGASLVHGRRSVRLAADAGLLTIERKRTGHRVVATVAITRAGRDHIGQPVSGGDIRTLTIGGPPSRAAGAKTFPDLGPIERRGRPDVDRARDAAALAAW